MNPILPLSIGLRYLRVRRRSRFLSVVALVAILGVALGVASLIVVLSVMNGLKQLQVEQLLGVGHQVVLRSTNSQGMDSWHDLLASLAKEKEVKRYMQYAYGHVVLNHDGHLAGVTLEGIDAEKYEVQTNIRQRMLLGSVRQVMRVPFGIVLDRRIALRLNLVPGQHVMVLLPQGLLTPVGFLPRMRQFTVVGVFSVGERASAAVALTSTMAALRIFNLSGPNALSLTLINPFDSNKVARSLKRQLPAGIEVGTWQERHQALFSALANEQGMMFLLVGLAVLIAAFNVLGVLTVLVADKKPEIAVLATMGLSPGEVMAIFVSLGVAIGVIGIFLGLGIGLPIAFNVNAIMSDISRWIGHPILSMGGISVAGLPSRVESTQVMAIVILAAVLVIFASWIPSYRASRLSVVEALSNG